MAALAGRGRRVTGALSVRSRYWLVLIPFGWLAAFFLIPFAIVAKISPSDTAIARPPYVPTLRWEDGPTGWLEALSEFDFENYVWLTEEALYWKSHQQRQQRDNGGNLKT